MTATHYRFHEHFRFNSQGKPLMVVDKFRFRFRFRFRLPRIFKFCLTPISLMREKFTNTVVSPGLTFYAKLSHFGLGDFDDG
jgi:hypothetical protein